MTITVASPPQAPAQTLDRAKILATIPAFHKFFTKINDATERIGSTGSAEDKYNAHAMRAISYIQVAQTHKLVEDFDAALHTLDLALADLKKLGELDGGNKLIRTLEGAAHYHMAGALLAIGMKKEQDGDAFGAHLDIMNALFEIDAAVEKNPKNLNALFLGAKIAYALGATGKCVAYCNRVLSIDPDNKEAKEIGEKAARANVEAMIAAGANPKDF